MLDERRGREDDHRQDLVVGVLDDAVGVPARVSRGGLHNLRRRAAARGSVQVWPEPDGGTEALRSVPFDAG